MQGLSLIRGGKSSTHLIYRGKIKLLLECTKGVQRSGINLHHKIEHVKN